ncbi:MAG: ABC transporter substrate-binding protein [Elusimicrobia bacterium]|nr:ABC transporter substrate-binding protein [Elusimicrobiota bacterium]
MKIGDKFIEVKRVAKQVDKFTFRKFLCIILSAYHLIILPYAWSQVKNPDTYTYLTISDVDSMDPAWSYDTASHLQILNVYEPLLAYKGSSTEELEPLIATKIPTPANGLISKDSLTYTFPIRKGVVFHDGTPLTPEDVKYGLMRFMLQDRDAGPSSLLLEPILGYPATRDEKGKINEAVFKDADRAIQVKGDNVVVHLKRPYAPFLTILAQWGVVVSKKWAAANGDWDGTEATWEKYNNPKKESAPFFDKMNGTGPFLLERWDKKNKEIVLLRNDHYWRKPARLKRVITKGVDEFATRKLMLQAGDADAIYADRPVFPQVQNLEGVQIIDELPTMEMNPTPFFTFHIDTTANPDIGSGKLDGNGIPPDFFSDKDIRKGFAHAFDYSSFIQDVQRGKGTRATGCIPRSLPGHNPKQKWYDYDLKKAQEHFKKAWKGEVWKKGFQFTLTFNSGNVPRQTLCQIIKRNVESINPKFKIDVRPVQWSTFLDRMNTSKLPMFVLGWNADFPDPHNFAFPFMHSKGNFPGLQKYKNPQADRLVEDSIKEVIPAKRKAIYAKLLQLEYEDAPHLVLVDTVRYRTQRNWIKGWYHNPVFPDSPYGSYFYPIYKE